MKLCVYPGSQFQFKLVCISSFKLNSMFTFRFILYLTLFYVSFYRMSHFIVRLIVFYVSIYYITRVRLNNFSLKFCCFSPCHYEKKSVIVLRSKLKRFASQITISERKFCSLRILLRSFFGRTTINRESKALIYQAEFSSAICKLNLESKSKQFFQDLIELLQKRLRETHKSSAIK